MDWDAKHIVSSSETSHQLTSGWLHLRVLLFSLNLMCLWGVLDLGVPVMLPLGLTLVLPFVVYPLYMLETMRLEGDLLVLNKRWKAGYGRSSYTLGLARITGVHCLFNIPMLGRLYRFTYMERGTKLSKKYFIPKRDGQYLVAFLEAVRKENPNARLQ